MYIIAGIDPGTTVGLAFFDLNGNFIKVVSGKNMSKGEVIKQIRNAGTPSVIASDKYPCPEFVSQIATIFNVRLSCPNKDASHNEKMTISKDIKTNNDHEKDAYYAAYKAYHTFSNRLRKINNMNIDKKEEIMHKVLNGKTISSIIKSYDPLPIKPPVKPKRIKSSQPQTSTISKLSDLERKNNILTIQNEKLQRDNDSLNQQLLRVKAKQITKLKKEREIVKLRNIIRKLSNTINRKPNNKKTFDKTTNNKKHNDNKKNDSNKKPNPINKTNTNSQSNTNPKKVKLKKHKEDLKILLEDIVQEYQETREL